MYKKCLFLILITLPMVMFSQLEMTSSTSKKGWANDKNPTQVYLDFNRTQSYRTLLSNQDFLNPPLGERANETATPLWTYGLGIRAGILPFLRLEAGLTFLQNGEAYDFQSTVNDSSYHYVSKFRYIGMPVSLHFTYGNQFRFFIGPGINPLLFNSFNQKFEYTTELGGAYKGKLKEKSNAYASYILQVKAEAGVEYVGTKGIGMVVKCTYRRQLTNTYGKYSGFIHKSYGFGFSLGLVKNI